MGTVSRTYTYSAGAVIVAAQHNTNENTLYNVVNGNLDTNNLSPTSNIVDTQLTQITSAGKISGAALTSLASVPSAAGVLPTANVPPPGGQCRLTKSGANLLLSPYNGNGIVINGVGYSIPSAGVTLTPPATSNTSYYIYAYMVSTTITLEASATAYAVSSTAGNVGNYIKSGDDSRTLVGMARTVSSAWVDTSSQRFVLSWFNRNNINGLGTFSADRTTSSVTYVELNSEIRIEFLTWSSENVFVSVNGNNSGTNIGIGSGIGFNGTAVDTTFENASNAGNVQVFVPIGISGYKSGLTEGYNYVTLLGKVNGGTATWYGTSSTPATKVYMHLGIRG